MSDYLCFKYMMYITRTWHLSVNRQGDGTPMGRSDEVIGGRWSSDVSAVPPFMLLEEGTPRLIELNQVKVYLTNLNQL